jgi:hypothetical protein
MHRRTTFLAAGTLVLLLCRSLAQGGHIELRNNYHAYMFVASSPLTGNQFPETLGGMDDHVTFHAYLGGLLPDWDGITRDAVAILSNNSISAGERVQDYMTQWGLDPATDVVSIYNRNHQFLSRWNAPTIDAAGIAVGDFSHFERAITYDESGFPVGASEVWTGSNADGTSTGINAENWTSNSSFATYGLADAVGGPANLNAGIRASNLQRKVYGLLIFKTPEPEKIGVWVVPEPSTWMLGLIGAIGFALLTRRGAKAVAK